nr:zinc finger BED domain-containing protein 4-like isoform X1 [Paramormyrops kingsleyae]
MALKPLQDFTDALSGEEYVTISNVRPVLHLFNTSLLAHEDDDSELCKLIKTCIVDYRNAKYAEPATSDLLDMASLVDPRFRDKYIPSEKVNAVKNQAVVEVESLLADQGSRQPDTAEHTVLVPTDQAEIMPPTAKKKKSLASFFKQCTGTANTISTELTRREVTEKELSSYLQSPNVESDTDPLKWWKEHETLFPALSHLAKKYLLVPATSSPSERVFSCSGNIVTCHRASLKPETVDMLVFLAQNL